MNEHHEAMKLPEGKTCADCWHITRCMNLGFSWFERTSCDFHPSRFYEVPERKEEAVTQTTEDKDKMIEVLKAENERLYGQRERLERENRELKMVLSAAVDYIDKSPCDPDITEEQATAWGNYRDAWGRYLKGKEEKDG